ncbi:50S ribosomal protein L23 [Patescibacteria group bacterium]
MAFFTRKVEDTKAKGAKGREDALGAKVHSKDSKEFKSGKEADVVGADKVKTAPAKKVSVKAVSTKVTGNPNTLLRPRITEKATLHAENGAYVFNVSTAASKSEIAKEVERVYGVKPEKVRTLPVPKKTVIRRNKKGVKSGGKKAIVYLKEGDTIEII